MQGDAMTWLLLVHASASVTPSRIQASLKEDKTLSRPLSLVGGQSGEC